MSSLAIITGASRGIGLAAATRFLNHSWKVYNISRTPCPLDGVENYLCDLAANASRLQAILKKFDFDRYDRVCLVHNAATYPHDTVESLEEKAFMQVLHLNVVVPQIINRALISQMPKGSSILFIGSTLSEEGTAGRLSYVASKHALAGLMRATCHDLESKDIHCCLICPGFTDTQMLRDAAESDPQHLSRVEKLVLKHRLIEPEEIAELIVFCAFNPVMNGSVVHANLGQK